jgi:hypothetical protein
MNLFLALVLHATLVLVRGYFLTVEFTLYPYLTSHGFLPYKEIIDQHFPTLLFGPFSLPSFLTINPWPLIAVFISILCLTDVLFYFCLVRFKIRQPAIWLLLFVTLSSYFSGNILWIEIIVNFLITLWLFLSFTKTKMNQFASGFLLSQILLLRPTIFPALLFVFFGLSQTITRPLILGLISGISVPIIYLVRHGLWEHFYRVVIIFNRDVYPSQAALSPHKKHLLTLLVSLLPVFWQLIKNKKILKTLSLLFLFVLAFPRFGFEHLQPLYLFATLFWAQELKKPNLLVFTIIIGLLVFNILTILRHSYGNYFYTPEIKEISAIVKSLPGDSVYLLGASDLIYPLSEKTPPHFTYLPSLPWYFTQEDLVSKVIVSLSDMKTPVVIDYSATIDGVNIVKSSGRIHEYIRMNFVPRQKLGNYQFFAPKP